VFHLQIKAEEVGCSFHFQKSFVVVSLLTRNSDSLKHLALEKEKQETNHVRSGKE